MNRGWISDTILSTVVYSIFLGDKSRVNLMTQPDKTSQLETGPIF